MASIDSVTVDTEVIAAPRKLGDTWDGWAGQVEENNGDLATSPWFFLAYLSSALAVMHAAAGVLWYLSEPRLLEVGSWLTNTISWGGMAFFAVMDVGLALVILTVLTGKNFVPYYKGKHIALSPLVPLVMKIATKTGLSKDRLTNSLLQVGNRITKANSSGIKKDELLILLPRCLSKETRDEIKQITERFDIVAHFCTGGQAARQLLVEKKPKGVIAVACERDLMSGVQDVKASIPVIAIANKRPEGPCRNTNIDLSEMEAAIRTYLGEASPSV